MAKRNKYPDSSWVQAQADEGKPVALLWEVNGPPNTRVAFLSCYMTTGGTVGPTDLFIVETMMEGPPVVFRMMR
jgi:hypothetical protein